MRSASTVSVRGLRKSFAGERKKGKRSLAVDGIDFDIEAGQLFTFLGPSGCGKTTTLRCLAGLEHPDEGEIAVADRIVYSSDRRIRVPSSDRGFGMVFQSYAIWPHMTVFENAAFPLRVLPRRKRPTRKAITERVERALATVQLHVLSGRQATTLSGGQQQRLALARTLVMEPPFLLLDEPLSNLDAKLRDEMRFELKRLQRDLGITTAYVTHDQSEALAMSSMIAVMNKGELVQLGKPREIYYRPHDKFVADFIGAANLLECIEILPVSDTEVEVTVVGGLKVRVLRENASTLGGDAWLYVRPESVSTKPTTDSSQLPDTSWIGVVEARNFLGNTVEHKIQIGEGVIKASGPSKRLDGPSTYAPGTKVELSFDIDDLRLVEGPAK
jgi:iron(III) transport system ATP-binding protein